MSLSRLIKFQLKDYYKSLFVFWGILLVADILIQSFVHFGFFSETTQAGTDMPFRLTINSLDVVQSNFAPIMNLVATGVFMLIAGIMAAAQTFPLMRSLQVTRSRIVSSTILGFGAANAIMVIVQSIISIVFALVLSMPEYIKSMLNPTFLFSYWSVLMLVSIAFYVVGAVFYRYGKWIGIMMFIVIGNGLPWLPIEHYMESMSQTILLNVCWLGSAVFSVIAYVLLRRARIKS